MSARAPSADDPVCGHPQPWPEAGLSALDTMGSGWLRATPAWWRGWLQRPELLPPEEACAAERRLHAMLQEDPLRAVSPAELSAVRDDDARSNWRHWLRLREAVSAAGSLQAWYLALMRSGSVDVPPLFIELVVQCMVCGMLRGVDDAFEWRAAELLFRAQRITRHEGQVLAGDRETLDRLHQTGGFGELGRLLAQAQAPLRRQPLQVLSLEQAAAYWDDAVNPQAGVAGGRWKWLLDLRHEATHDVGHGVRFKLTLSHGGLSALSRVLQRWVQHFLGWAFVIEPLSRIDDPHWRWHIGLDACSTALLNGLYEGREPTSAQQEGLISLFRLVPVDAHGFEDGVGRVYLGLSMDDQGVLRLKPQNLLLNLPLRAAS